jgi:hypothetical protein
MDLLICNRDAFWACLSQTAHCFGGRTGRTFYNSRGEILYPMDLARISHHVARRSA